MTQKHQFYFWHRRVLQLAIGVALFVVLFYGLIKLLGDRLVLDAMLSTGPIPLICAGLTIILAGAGLTPNLRQKFEKILAPLAQLALSATVAILIIETGGLYSPLLLLWVPAIIFVGVFGPAPLGVAAIIPFVYGGYLAYSDGLLFTNGLTLLLVGEVPLIISYLLFSHLGNDKEDNTYTQLANQFSQVSDKSEVVITAITDGVIATDQQGIIELINPAAQHLIGWESRDALKLDYKSVLKLLDKESAELTPANDPIRQALSTNQEVRSDAFTLVTNSGKKLLISLVASPVGQPGSGVIIVFRDITKEKAEEREQAEFISTASHEMRTPVASIEGYLGLALNPATAQIDDKARTYITKAHEVAQHLGRLFQDLLDITKAEDGRLSNNPRAIEIVSFVHDIIEGLRPQAEAKGLILVYKPMPDDAESEKSNRRLNPVFYANIDNDHFREVVANLIENAIKYTKQGTVSVDVSGDDKQIEVSIQDTGIGIPAEDLPHLFQKFYRVDNSDTREIGGTGLGLYLSRRLVETMEGRVWAESQHGQGSTFFISIPRISHEEAMRLIETINDETTPIVVTPETAMPIGVSPDTPRAPVAPVMAEPAQPLPTPPPSAEGAFANPPADVIAAQLVTGSSPSPAQPPIAPTGPSLASIEQNPSQYLGRSATPRITPMPRPQAPVYQPNSYPQAPNPSAPPPESQNQP